MFFGGGDPLSNGTIDEKGNFQLAAGSGRVSDGRGQMLRDSVVVIQPAEAKEPIVASRWIRTARPDNKRTVRDPWHATGSLRCDCDRALEQGRQFAPEFQEQLRHAGREFAVREGESIALDLTLTPNL